MGSWLTKIIARWASVQGPGKDTDQFPVQQVTYQGKVADCVMLFPYGMHANVDGVSLGVMYSMEGNPENRVMLPTSMTRRSQLESGDVEIYSPVSRSRVTLRGNGHVEVEAEGALTVTSVGNVTVTAPQVEVIGNVLINGNLEVNGTMTNNGKDVGDTHGHIQGNDSRGDSEAPISGVT